MQFTQGFAFRLKVKNEHCKLIFISPIGKYTVETITEEEGNYFLTASADETKDWIPGRYQYQLQDDVGIYEHGDFFVLRNFALQDSTNYLSIWEKAIKQIDDILAGRASSASKTINVGDKGITYTSLDELLKLRDYFAHRLAEEEKELGEDSFDKNNQHKIMFQWRG